MNLLSSKDSSESVVSNVLQNFSRSQEKAFRILYEKYAPSLRFFAAKYLKSEEGIDDVIQDTFVCLWEQRTNFDSEKSLKAFLYKMVKNSCLNIIRHRGVKERYETEAAWEDGQEFFLENILKAEVFELVMGVFNELPPATRKVYRLSLDGRSHEEIADLLNISINTVKKHKNNANHYMRKRMESILVLIAYIINHYH